VPCVIEDQGTTLLVGGKKNKGESDIPIVTKTSYHIRVRCRCSRSQACVLLLLMRLNEVREASDFITKMKGGHGAVREVCELVLKCQGKWRDILDDFTGK
jgi:hypothetical protein